MFSVIFVNQLFSLKLSPFVGLFVMLLTSLPSAKAVYAAPDDRTDLHQPSAQTTPLNVQLPLILAESTAPVTQPKANQSRPIWGCGAENSKRSYVVDQLNRDDNSFDMAIYKGTKGNEADYLGTVRVAVTQKDPELVGHGQTSSGTLNVRAFGRSTLFTVEDKVNGSASGRCSVQWEMADDITRRQVRQCLAFVARKYSGVPEVARFGCTGDPKAYLEELKRPR